MALPRQLVCLSLVLAVASACHSPGAYGHSRSYSALDAETEAAVGAKDYDPVMVQRSPEKFRDQNLSVFGVVQRRRAGGAGEADLMLSVRSLEARNLCADRTEESCRVTVSERHHGVVHVRVALDQADDIGKESVGVGSLVRVVGRLSDAVDGEDGSPVLSGGYYRHWPKGFYVTTADRENMRR